MQAYEVVEVSKCGKFRIIRGPDGYNIKTVNPAGFPKYKIIARANEVELASWKQAYSHVEFAPYAPYRVPKPGDPDFPEYLLPGPRRNFVTVWKSGNRRITASDTHYNFVELKKGLWTVTTTMSAEEFARWHRNHADIVITPRPPRKGQHG
jgi:hypothetical protein